MQDSDQGARREETYFAPGERASDPQLRSDIELASNNALIDAVLSTAGGLVVVVNEQRQLVAVNNAYLRLLGVDEPEGVLGLRPGEVLNCPFALAGPSGCGTSQACRTCGAAIAMLAAQTANESREADCAISAEIGGVVCDLDFTVRTSPLVIEGRNMVLMFLRDVSAQRRREALERSFLHDLSNLVLGLVGTAELLADSGADDDDEDLVQDLEQLSQRVYTEINVQRALSQGTDYTPILEPVDLAPALEHVLLAVLRHPAAHKRSINLDFKGEQAVMQTDRVIVERILANMVINALEATPPGSLVQLSCRTSDDLVELEVHNEGLIPPDVQPRIFQRYFSTKSGTGRGHGTFSMKYFGEQCLGGKLSFSSSKEHGTKFVLRLPRNAPEARERADVKSSGIHVKR